MAKQQIAIRNKLTCTCIYINICLPVQLLPFLAVTVRRGIAIVAEFLESLCLMNTRTCLLTESNLVSNRGASTRFLTYIVILGPNSKCWECSSLHFEQRAPVHTCMFYKYYSVTVYIAPPSYAYHHIAIGCRAIKTCLRLGHISFSPLRQ